MKTKEQIANELNISRKSLYNYMNELNIKNLTEENNVNIYIKVNMDMVIFLKMILKK